MSEQFEIKHFKNYITNMHDTYFIGFDIGGTNTRAILWKNGKILNDIVMPTAQTLTGFKKNINNSVKHMNIPGQKFAVGIGVAGIVKGTSLVFAPNIPKIQNFNFQSLFPKGTPVMVDNDARCFLRNDMSTKTATKNAKTFAFTIGTGFGRAFAENRKVKPIKQFEKPEPWEQEYQQIRNSQDYPRLAHYLSEKMMPFIKKYQPDIIFFGGGLAERKPFYEKIKKHLKTNGVNAEMVRSHTVKHSGSLGAILNYFY